MEMATRASGSKVKKRMVWGEGKGKIKSERYVSV